MLHPRRDFLKQLLSSGAFPALLSSPKFFEALLDPQNAKQINPNADTKAQDFWSSFLKTDGLPAASAAGEEAHRAAGTADSDPVFLHFGTDGFKYASRLDATKLVEEGDVLVSVNTSTIKIGTEDQKTFQRVQNAQIRVDVAQKTPIVPVIEAMCYTLVAGMSSAAQKAKAKSSAKSSSKSNAHPTVQNISISSDADWQKMQNVPLKGGEGRWALNLEAQRKDSLFGKVLQEVVKQAGLFTPVLGFTGIALSALQSFNLFYGLLHSEPVEIIKSAPVPVWATQEAFQRTGSAGNSVTGIMLQSGTYVLTPARQAPSPDELKKYTVTQGRLVPSDASAKGKELSGQELDEAAASTLKDVTYVTFDVEVVPTVILGDAAKKAA